MARRRMPEPGRVFLLSPASAAGERARMVLDERAGFDLARRLRSRDGVPLGELYAFLSSLYFRGKLRYASAFARPPAGVPGVLVITPCDGLLEPAARVGIAALRRWKTVPIDVAEPAYLHPLARDARRLARSLAAHAATDVVLLGSIATVKYVEPLSAALGARLRFPIDFVGRGDMSRGGLLLRTAAEGRELEYARIDGAARRGSRPPRLTPLRAAAGASRSL